MITTYANTVEEFDSRGVCDSLAESVVSSLIAIVDQIATVADPTSSAAVELVKEIQTDT